jgi:hypothetical protein
MTPPAPQEPRRHHYVPRCWLAGFTDTGEKDGRLWVTDLFRRRQFQTVTGNAGVITDFYRLDEAPDPVVVERFFSTLEGLAAPVLKALNTERRPPKDDELDLLLQFIAYQWVRVPSFRPLVLGIADRITRERMAEEMRTPETWRTCLIRAGIAPEEPGADYESMKAFWESGEYNITAETAWYLQRAFLGVDRILEGLRKRYWGTAYSPAGRLIASDNPVVLDGEANQMIGFGNAEVIIYPVSRHILLAGTLAPVKAPPMTYRYFAAMNTMMMLRADAQVYSNVADFPWADENRNVHTDWQLFSRERVLGRQS